MIYQGDPETVLDSIAQQIVTAQENIEKTEFKAKQAQKQLQIEIKELRSLHTDWATAISGILDQFCDMKRSELPGTPAEKYGEAAQKSELPGTPSQKYTIKNLSKDSTIKRSQSEGGNYSVNLGARGWQGEPLTDVLTPRIHKGSLMNFEPCFKTGEGSSFAAASYQGNPDAVVRMEHHRSILPEVEEEMPTSMDTNYGPHYDNTTDLTPRMLSMLACPKVVQEVTASTSAGDASHKGKASLSDETEEAALLDPATKDSSSIDKPRLPSNSSRRSLEDNTPEAKIFVEASKKVSRASKAGKDDVVPISEGESKGGKKPVNKWSKLKNAIQENNKDQALVKKRRRMTLKEEADRDWDHIINMHGGLSKKFHRPSIVGGEQSEGPESSAENTAFSAVKVIPISRLVIEPTNSYKQTWDFGIFVLILYSAFFIPLRFAYPFESVVLDVGDVMMEVIFVVDLVITFFTAIQDGDNTIRDLRKIRSQYLKSWFSIDLVSSIPLSLMVYAGLGAWVQSIKLTKLFRLLRLSRLLRLFRLRKLSNVEESLTVNPGLVRLLKLVFFLILILHWLACVLQMVADEPTSEESVDVFLDHQDFLGKSAGTQYGVAFYCVIALILGEMLSPQTDLQVALVVTITLIGMFVYASLVGNLVSLLGHLDSSSGEMSQRMEELSEYMVKRNFPSKLRQRVRKYYTQVLARTKGVDDNRMLETLPEYLRQEVALFLNRKMVFKVPMLEKCSISFITELVTKVVPLSCIEEDFIIRHGTIGREMYFLTKGTVAVLDQSGNQIAIMTEVCFFGEVSLLYNTRRGASVQALTQCDLLSLDKNSLWDLLDAYPEDSMVITNNAVRRHKARTTNSVSEAGILEDADQGDNSLFLPREVAP